MVGIDSINALKLLVKSDNNFEVCFISKRISPSI